MRAKAAKQNAETDTAKKPLLEVSILVAAEPELSPGTERFRDRERRTEGTPPDSIDSPSTVAKDSTVMASFSTNLQHRAQIGSKMHKNELDEVPK